MKHILAIHANGRTVINPQVCKHEHTVTIHAGRQYTIAGEATDDVESYEMCLDCDYIRWDDGTWHENQQEIKTQIEIPY